MAYNILQANSECPHCQNENNWDIQYKYALTRGEEYKLGDEIYWGDDQFRHRGNPDYIKVKVEGLAGSCPHCNEEVFFDIVIEHNILRKVVPKTSKQDCESEDGYKYKVLKK